MAKAKMQTIKEEGAVKAQCLLLLPKSPKILDQFKGAPPLNKYNPFINSA